MFHFSSGKSGNFKSLPRLYHYGMPIGTGEMSSMCVSPYVDVVSGCVLELVCCMLLC